MRTLEQTSKIKVATENEAIKLIEEAKNKAKTSGSIITKSGYVYKTKKAKDGPYEAYIVTITEKFGDIWEEEEANNE